MGKLLLWSSILGALFGGAAEVLLAWPSIDGSILWKVMALSAAKGALIGWLTPRTIQFLVVALIIGMLLGGFFWSLMAVPGTYPVGSLHPANIVPGAVLGAILILKARPQARRALALERERYPT